MPPNLIRQAAERITPESTRDSASVDAGCVGPCTPQSPIDSYSSRHSAGSVCMHRDGMMKAILRALEQCELRSARVLVRRGGGGGHWWTLLLKAECLANLNGK